MARPRKNATANANDDSSTQPKKRARKSEPAQERERRRPAQAAQRSSAFRGVTRHRWTGRFEAHLWDKDTWNHESRARAKKKKKGKQVYLGAYDDEEAAARAHDLAALKYWGTGAVLNFPLCSYDEELKEMEGQSREEYIGSVRRKSSGFSRGVSKYRGVARHHHNGRWEARIGRVLGNKYLYLGTYATQEEAAVAYDIAAIEHRGLNAVTNFDVSHYINWHRRRRLTEHASAVALDEPLADIADSYISQQLPDDDPVMTTPPAHKAPPPSPALDLLLLQSPKFMEIMEQVSAAAAAEISPSPSCTSSLSSASLLSHPSPERRPVESSGGASSVPARRSFPDDVQTYFECDGDGMMSFAFVEEVDTFLFGDLGSYAAPMFQCDLDAFSVDSSS